MQIGLHSKSDPATVRTVRAEPGQTGRRSSGLHASFCACGLARDCQEARSGWHRHARSPRHPASSPAASPGCTPPGSRAWPFTFRRRPGLGGPGGLVRLAVAKYGELRRSGGGPGGWGRRFFACAQRVRGRRRLRIPGCGGKRTRPGNMAFAPVAAGFADRGGAGLPGEVSVPRRRRVRCLRPSGCRRRFRRGFRRRRAARCRAGWWPGPHRRGRGRPSRSGRG